MIKYMGLNLLQIPVFRSGRLDRKIEFPAPTEEARARIMQIHSRKMNVSPDVNFDELARSTDDFNGAQCKVSKVNLFARFALDNENHTMGLLTCAQLKGRRCLGFN